MDWFPEKKIELTLKPILEKVETMKRGRRFVSVEVFLYKEDEASKLQYEPAKCRGNRVYISIYGS